ncbi:hypothetical protein EC07E033_44310 [Escherichia coli]|nr:hypothetical protein EC142370_04487 [Escherichia coli O145:H34]GIP93557.1 hypothetical protein EC07E033_44310 [Escherichia coli]
MSGVSFIFTEEQTETVNAGVSMPRGNKMNVPQH